MFTTIQCVAIVIASDMVDYHISVLVHYVSQ